MRVWRGMVRRWAVRVARELQRLVSATPLARLRVENGYREIYLRWVSDAPTEWSQRMQQALNFLTNPAYFRGVAPFTMHEHTVTTNRRVYRHISLVYADTPYALPRDETLESGEFEVGGGG